MSKCKKKKSFFLEMLSGGNGNISSKRVLGSFILLLLTIATTINMFYGANNEWLGNVIETLIITSGALVGLGIADKAFNKIITTHKSFGNDFEDTEEISGGDLNDDEQC